MGRLGLLLLLVAALCAGDLEGSGEPSAPPGGSPSPGPPLPELCLLPKVVGRCRASFPRWWYNATSQACQKFTYGGCGANLNNFLAEDKCRLTCVAAADKEDVNEIPLASRKIAQGADGEPIRRVEQASDASTYEERCLAEAKTGLCRASFPRWWFDAETKTCRQFTYGGCGGNQNNYLSEEACLRRCSESCAAPRLTGPCRAAFPRWYYDPAAGACKQFIYGGCKGNKNNYLREELCVSQCSGATGGAEGPKTEQPDVHLTRVVVLAVLLAIIAAVLLGTVVVFFVKICKKNQELALGVPWSPLDDKEYLMSNAYTL
ncbi:kunitz-type protease inhibitor 2 [Emydura macquarii macquarii]|uniref:kunitz-type protease inhibitor 2 n=1 Tax=Emydura macquarii macquarii TaxID=1129001 RepID=UPI00352AE4F1